MKKVFKGWVGKTDGLSRTAYWNYRNTLSIWMFKRKGGKHEWCTDDWPPKRVTVTVEVEE